MLEITYRKTDQTRQGNRIITTVEEGKKPLTVPKRWGMFTAAGNARLTKIATDAYKKIEALHDAYMERGSSSDEYTYKRNISKVLVNMLYKWDRMSDYKTYREASDTAVREQIGDFHDKLWEAVTGEGGWDEWDRNLDAAYKKASKFREKKAS